MPDALLVWEGQRGSMTRYVVLKLLYSHIASSRSKYHNNKNTWHMTHMTNKHSWNRGVSPRLSDCLQTCWTKKITWAPSPAPTPVTPGDLCLSGHWGGANHLPRLHCTVPWFLSPPKNRKPFDSHSNSHLVTRVTRPYSNSFRIQEDGPFFTKNPTQPIPYNKSSWFSPRVPHVPQDMAIP